jgi:hypothetical protein
VRTAFAIGVAVATRPRYCTTVVVGAVNYCYWGGAYYVSSGSTYVVAAPPPGAVVYAVPSYTTVTYIGSTPYYYAGGTYYVATDKAAAKPKIPEGVELKESAENPPMIEDDHNFEVVSPPVGATVPYLPDDAVKKVIGERIYYVYLDTYYRPFVSDGDTIYRVVEDPARG